MGAGLGRSGSASTGRSFWGLAQASASVPADIALPAAATTTIFAAGAASYSVPKDPGVYQGWDFLSLWITIGAVAPATLTVGVIGGTSVSVSPSLLVALAQLAIPITLVEGLSGVGVAGFVAGPGGNGIIQVTLTGAGGTAICRANSALLTTVFRIAD